MYHSVLIRSDGGLVCAGSVRGEAGRPGGGGILQEDASRLQPESSNSDQTTDFDGWNNGSPVPRGRWKSTLEMRGTWGACSHLTFLGCPAGAGDLRAQPELGFGVPSSSRVLFRGDPQESQSSRMSQDETTFMAFYLPVFSTFLGVFFKACFK